VRVSVAAIIWLTRLIERAGRLTAQIQFFLYGIVPALLPPEELSAWTRTYYKHSYEGLDREFHAEAYKWTLESWEEAVRANHMGEKGTVLILGAGLGREAIALAHYGYRVLGIDNNLDGLRIAAKRASVTDLPLTFVQGDFRKLPVCDQQADYLFLSGVMYSAIPGRHQRQECVRQFRLTLQKDGKVALNFLLSHEWQTRTHRTIDRINRWLKKLPGSNQAYQPGDFCSHGHFMHAFLDEAEIRSELIEAGATILELNWSQGFVVIS
jgi:ubiquinone/menaquinone biosynthesis C-methylase UbiE